MGRLVFANDVFFPYRNSHGSFLVHYCSHGYGEVYPCADPETFCRKHGRPDRSHFLGLQREFDEATGNYPSLLTWTHSQSFPRGNDLAGRDDLADRTKRMRELFLTDQIAKTPLETPDQRALARLDFLVTTRTGNRLRVVLREDGKGQVIETVNWMAHLDDESIRCAGTHPHPLFRHDIDPRFIRDNWTRIQGELPEAKLLQEKFESYFWSDINPKFTSRWIRTNDEIKSRPLRVGTCSLAELQDLMTCIGRVDDQAWSSSDGDSGELDLVVRSSFGGGRKSFDSRDGDNNLFSETTYVMLELVAEWARIEGYSVTQFAGKADCWLSFSLDAHFVEAAVSAPTASERMEALDRLLTWSDQTRIDITSYLPA